MVWGWEKSQGLGKWVSICFLDPDNKRKNNKKTGQMAALVKAEDMGETGMRMRDCMEEARAAGDL